MIVSKVDPYKFPISFLKQLYRDLLVPRLIEEKMLLLLRKGKISKWFSGIGQEAIAVGAVRALEADEFVFPMHRNLGVFTTRGLDLEKLFNQFRGSQTGFTRGRDRSFHFGSIDDRVIGMISHLGPQLSLAGGVALASKLRGLNKLALAFTGEGGTSEGEFHEALNVAAVWKLPVIFVVENNGYGLSTPVSEQYACENLSDRAVGYGMLGETINGNDILEVYNCISQYAEKIRKNPEPVLIECQTFRMRGHEEASGTAYVPEELFEIWAERDPIQNFEKQLVERQIITPEEIAETRASVQLEIDQVIDSVYDNDFEIVTSIETELTDIFAEGNIEPTTPTDETVTARFVDAISDGLYQGLERFPELVLMGQDVGAYGGVFKVSKDFVHEFGADRIRNTPLCESAILGNALGLSLVGMKAVVEMQFADFVSCGMTQIVNYLAKIHYRWGQAADVVVRLPCGAGVAAGPFHSQTMEAWFTHTAGLKVVYPAFPQDAKGLLVRAIEDPNPVMFFEHKKLYRSTSAEVPVGYYSIPFGKAMTVQEGTEASIITYGLGVHWAIECLAETGFSCDVIDLRTLVPLDWEAIQASVEKTGRVLVLYEAPYTGGYGAEIAALVAERCFEFLDAPVVRCASLDTPIPFVSELEQQYLAVSRLKSSIEKLVGY